MKVCEQTLKPRARALSDVYMRNCALPPDFRWYCTDGLYAGWGSTLNEALQGWRANRLSAQLFNTSGWSHRQVQENEG